MKKRKDIDKVELIEFESGLVDIAGNVTNDVEKVLIVHHVSRTTDYNIRNNSTFDVETLYLDHKAGTAHDGFVIVTKGEECIKSVTGFSRYSLSLGKSEEVPFSVEEEAKYIETFSVDPLHIVSNMHKILKFLKLRAPLLRQQKILTDEAEKILRDGVALGRLISALRTFASSGPTESLMQTVEKENVELPPRTRALATKILKLSFDMGESRRILEIERAKERQVVENTTRLRDNIKSLEKFPKSSLIGRYTKDLDKEEDILLNTRTTIEKLAADLVKIERDIQVMKTDLSDEANKALDSIHPRLR